MATETVSIVIKAFDQTQKALRGIQAAFGKLSKVFFNFKTALISAVGTAGLGLLINNSLKATDALAKTAGRIGTTTEALSALQYAGQLTGVEVNTMNMALQRFTRRTAEAAVGTGEAKGALRELGVDARELVQLPLDQRMLVLADAFSGVQNESDRLRLAFKLFDSEGAALVNTLGQGRDGLAGMLGEAQALGLVMSSDAAAGVESANDSITRLFSVSKGLIDQFTAALAPAIEFVANSLTKFSQQLMVSEGGARTFAINSAAAFLEFASSAINNFERFANGVIVAFNMIIGAANLFSPVISGINFLFEALVEGIKGQINTIISFTQLIDRALERFGKKPIFNLEQFNLQPVTFALQTFEKIDRVDFSGTVNGLRGIADLVRETAEVATTAGDAIQTMAAPPSNFEAFIERLKQSRTQADDLQDGLIKLANQGIDGLGKSFTAAITGAQNFADAIKSMAKSVIDSLIQMLVQKYIVDAAFGAITGALGGGATPSTGGGGGGSGMSLGGLARGGVATGNTPYIVGEEGPELMTPRTTGRVTSYDQLMKLLGEKETRKESSAFERMKLLGEPNQRANVLDDLKLPQFADGGVATGGRPAIVGERGPEVFIPNRTGRVIPNDELGGRGVVVNQTINVTTGVQQTVRAEIANLLPQISNAAKSAVADARMRGGGFSKAMVGA